MPEHITINYSISRLNILNNYIYEPLQHYLINFIDYILYLTDTRVTLERQDFK